MYSCIAGPSLKVIGTMSAGYDHIDLAACRERGIRVGYTPGVLTDATATLTVTLLLTASRRISEGMQDNHANSCGWSKWSPSECLLSQIILESH